MKPKKLMYKLASYLSYTAKSKKNYGKPLIRQLEPTNACMMDCKMCPRKNMKRKIEFMSMELFRKIIDQAKWNEHIWLHHFGDPLIHPKIIDMIQYTFQKGIIPKMSVNPILITKDLAEKLVVSGLDTLLISLDSASSKTYNHLRGVNADFNKAIKNIDYLLKVKAEKKSKMIVLISFIKMKSNISELEDFKKLWAGKDVELLIKDFGTFGTSDKLILDQAIDPNSFKIRKKNLCFFPWSTVAITASGKVVPCCNDYDEKYVIGDLNHESLESIWNNQNMKKLRTQILTDRTCDNPLCRTCTEPVGVSLKDQISNLFKKL